MTLPGPEILSEWGKRREEALREMEEGNASERMKMDEKGFAIF